MMICNRGLFALISVLLSVSHWQQPPAHEPFGIPWIDLSSQTYRQIIVDQEAGQYLGHPTTVLLPDQRTLLIVYPKGHGKGPIILKKSRDGGLKWSERLPTPASWTTSQETPTIYATRDSKQKYRLLLFSGLFPIRSSVSEDLGVTWSELKPIGPFGGIVAMSSLVELRTGPGHYLAFFHDDGRYFQEKSKATKPATFTLYQSRTSDGGLTWEPPQVILARQDIHLCEPGAIRSPDGKEIALLLRENTRTKNSHVIFSRDEGKSWTEPKELPSALSGDRHVARYAPDGRLLITFRDAYKPSPTAGDWVGWVGKYEDLHTGHPGQYRFRIMDNQHAWDCAYAGLELLPDGTFVTTTYGHWTKGESPYIVCVRFKISELDEQVSPKGRKDSGSTFSLRSQ